MSIVFLTPVGTLGGAERSLVDLAAIMSELRPDLKLHVITGAEGPLSSELKRIDVSYEVIEMPRTLRELGESSLQGPKDGKLLRMARLAVQGARASLAVPKYYATLRKRIASARPAVIHSNGIKCHLMSGHVAPHSVPVVWHVRDFLSTRPLVGGWLRKFARHPAAIIANSLAVQADVKRLFPSVPVHSVYNGIDTTYFAPGPNLGATLDELSGLSPAERDVIRVGLVATYARWKGQDVFIDSAAKIINSKNSQIRFYIIGGPTYSTHGSQFSEAELRTRISNSGAASKHIGIIPFQNDLRNIYRGLDIVVHASIRAEPFGRTIIEGMSCGRAVIVTLGGGATELFTDGYDAIGVSAGDVDALAAAILGLSEHPERRAVLATNARASAEARFKRKQMGESVLDVYNSLTDLSASTAPNHITS